MIPLPEDVARRNGLYYCDMLVGPCSCGGWHRKEDLTENLLDEYYRIQGNN